MTTTLGTLQGIADPGRETRPAVGEAREGGSSSVPAPRRKFIYILGSGRCGSTLLEIILGSHPQIRATGEYHGIPFPKWLPAAVCSCQASFDRCTFWAPIYEQYTRSIDVEHHRREQGRFENYSSLPRTLAYALFGSRSLRQHAERMQRVIPLIASASGKPFVVESSKSAVRGFVYRLAPGSDLDIYYIHLVRDGRAYIRSKLGTPDGGGLGRRAMRQHPLAPPLEWMMTNLLAVLLCGRPRDRYLRLRYEEFIGDPAGSLRAIGTFLGVDLSEVADAVRQGRGMPIVHLLGGNRLRFSDSIRVVPHHVDETGVGRREDWLYRILAGWLAILFGYRISDPQRAPRSRAPTSPGESG